MEVTDSYKQTEVGLIPNDWNAFQLGELAEFITSGSRGWAAYYSDYGALFIRSQNVRAGQLDLEDCQFVNPPLGAEGNRTRVNRDDVLITITGNSVGNVAHVECEFEEAFISQHVGLVRLFEAHLGQYVSRFLSPGSPGNSQIWASQSGQSKPGLTLRNLQEFWVAIPPTKAEQLAIATALSDVDVLLDGLTRLVAKKLNLKQAAMQQLLTGLTRLPGFSGNWETKRLGNHLTFLKNGVNSRAELTTEGKVKYLHYGDIHGAASLVLNPSAMSMPYLPVAKAGRLDRLSDGDLVFADASEDLDGVGKSVELNGLGQFEVVSGLHTIAIRFDKQVLADGFKAYLQFMPVFRQHLRRLAAGTKVYATNRAHIASAELKLPDVREQTAIATVLSDMDAELSALDVRLTKTRALKQAMMQELLTGRIRLV